MNALKALVSAFFVMAIAACGGMESPIGQEQLTQGAEGNIASIEQAISSVPALLTANGWTAYTSDGKPPINCDSNNLFSAVQCKGRYCDDIRAYCHSTGGVFPGTSYWTPYFSEEGTSSQTCSSNYWVTGLACSGSYCDNISLYCSKVNSAIPFNCNWTGWMSEENGGELQFGSGRYARGAHCSGSYCDNKRFYVCEMEVCGNGSCAHGETTSNCTADCGCSTSCTGKPNDTSCGTDCSGVCWSGMCML